MDRDALLMLILQQSPRVVLLSADRFGKSSAWVNFMRVKVDGDLQPYAVCRSCNAILKYEARRGTGSLLRHRCFHLRRNTCYPRATPDIGTPSQESIRSESRSRSPRNRYRTLRQSSVAGVPVIQQLYEYEDAVQIDAEDVDVAGRNKINAGDDAESEQCYLSTKRDEGNGREENERFLAHTTRVRHLDDVTELLEDMRPADPHFATKAIHEGQDPRQWTSGAVNPPIHLATTFQQDSPGQDRGYCYGRSGNPSRTCLEKCLASLENAKYCCCFASGLAATTCVALMLKTGDHIVSVNDVYGGTSRFLRRVISEMGIETTFVDATDPENVKKSLRPNTKLVWMETPTNPTMQLVDIQAVANIVKQQKDIIYVVDNTFMSSYFQQPLSFGADVVMHSLTKYMNGHSDSIMGCLCTSNEELFNRMKFLQNSFGAVPSPFECFLVNRGLKTLHLRMREHMKNGLAVARFLENHPCVEKVIYPGLPSHPQHKLARRQCSGFSGMMSFYIRGGLAETNTFLKKLKVFILAESLGGFESLAEHPAVMTHASVPEDHRNKLGISDNLIRLSVGLEDAGDLVNDLDQALRAAVV